MPRKTPKAVRATISQGRNRPAGKDGRSGASTRPYPRRSGGLVRKGR